MKDIRKGNDIQYTWTVKNLEGVNGEKVVQLISCKTNEAQEAMTYSISGNVITGTFYGKDQKDVGAYRLLLLVNDGYDNMVTLDKVNAFNLTGVCNFGIVRGADDNAIETVVLEFEREIHVNVGASGEQVQADWDETNTDSPAYIRNKPTIPPAQVQSDWNQSNSSAVDYIKNKPTIPDVSNFIEKSQTAGLVKNDGTIDTTSYQSALASQTAYTSKGSATKVPQITTNALGQVTGITEVTITQPDVSNFIEKSQTAGLVKNDGTIDTTTYQSALASQTAYTSKGSATKVPQITTNALGQVTGITEVTITQPDVSNLIAKSETVGLVRNDGTIDTSTYLTSAHEVPAGGNAGQVLAKNSSTDYDIKWVDQTQYYPSAYCTTSAGTAAKKASCSLYQAQANSYLHILIGAANTSAGAITLNVNSAGAKPIYINGEASSYTNYTLPAGTYIVFYDGTNYYFRTDGKIQASATTVLANTSEVGGKEDKMAIDSTVKTASFTASVGNYYTVNIAASGSVTITLTTPSDNTHISNAVFLVTTSTSPALTFAAASGVDIYVSSSYSIEASKIYEINALWNGTNWSIASVELEAQS